MVPVKKFKKGLKVVRGPDWDYADQDKGSDYGILTVKHDNCAGWFHVDWYKDGKVISGDGYRIGEDEFYDLAYYEEPIFEKVNSTIDKLITKYEKDAI